MSGSSENNIVRIEIDSVNVPSGDINSGAYNAPAGLQITHHGTMLDISSGVVVGDDGFLYRIKEDLTKRTDSLFEPGDNKGCMAYGEEFGDGKWNVFVITNGYTSDIFVSQKAEPVWPAADEKPEDVPEEDWYSIGAANYRQGYRIGYFLVENDEITKTYPSKDLGHSFLDEDLVFQDEFDDYKSETDVRFNNVDTAIVLEAQSRETADTALDTKIDNTATAIRGEMSDEHDARIAAEGTLQDNIDAETAARRDADTALQEEFADALAQSEAALQGLISDEEDARIAADEALTTAVETETSAREDADAAITSSLGEETEARIDADADLEAALESEASEREAADTTLDNRLTAAESTIVDHTAHLGTLDNTVSENNAAAVHKLGTETISGVKTFAAGLKTGEAISADSNNTTVPSTAWVTARISETATSLANDIDALDTGLTTYVDGKDSAMSGRVNQTFNAVSYNSTNGKLTFTRDNSQVVEIDLPLEWLVDSGYYDAATQELVLVLKDEEHTEIRIDVHDLVDVYTAGSGLSLSGSQFSVNTTDTTAVDTTVTANSTKLVQSGAVSTAVANSLATARQELADAIAAIEDPSDPTSVESRLEALETAVTAMGNIILQAGHDVIGVETEGE